MFWPIIVEEPLWRCMLGCGHRQVNDRRHTSALPCDLIRAISGTWNQVLRVSPSPFGSGFLQLNDERLPGRFVAAREPRGLPEPQQILASPKSIPSSLAKRYMRPCPKSGLAYY